MGLIRKIVKKKIGKEVHTFQVEGENFHDLIMETKKMSFGHVNKCGLCGSENLELTAHVAKSKFKQTLIKCRDCKGFLNFGQQMENPQIFYLKTLDDQNGQKKLDWRPGTELEK